MKSSMFLASTQALPVLLQEFAPTHKDTYISYLPMPHIYEIVLQVF